MESGHDFEDDPYIRSGSGKHKSAAADTLSGMRSNTHKDATSQAFSGDKMSELSRKQSETNSKDNKKLAQLSTQKKKKKKPPVDRELVEAIAAEPYMLGDPGFLATFHNSQEVTQLVGSPEV